MAVSAGGNGAVRAAESQANMGTGTVVLLVEGEVLVEFGLVMEGDEEECSFAVGREEEVSLGKAVAKSPRPAAVQAGSCRRVDSRAKMLSKQAPGQNSSSKAMIFSKNS